LSCGSRDIVLESYADGEHAASSADGGSGGVPYVSGSYADGESHAAPCAIYDRRELRAGNVIHGPAVVEEPASSTLLGLGDRAEVNEYGHLVIELA